MKKIGNVPAEWGSLNTLKPLSKRQVDEKAKDLLSQMTLKEKIHQMSGDIPLVSGVIEMQLAYNKRPYPAGENIRLGIPGIRFSDGPRGVVMYHSTCFPVSMARGAAWDIDLEERVGDAIGVEARSQGANFFGGVCINLLRHPAWGRAQETYGEDSFHLGEMGAALVRGVQRHIMACVKHYAANSMENARFKVDVKISERPLREVYLPHFKRCIDEGAAAVMSAYNKLNGAYCGHNGHLLRDILKNEWGFEGFVISDFLLGIRETVAAVEGGMDIEMPFTWHFGKKLYRQVKRGRIRESLIDDAVLRILRQKIRFAQTGEPERYGKHAVVCDAHKRLAREAAQKSIVLLKNECAGKGKKPLLPIDCGGISKIAVLGKLATARNIGDSGSSMVRPPYVVTPLEGIQAALASDIKIIYNDGKNIQSAAREASVADLAIIIAGYTHRHEGEYIPLPPKGGDRKCLSLSTHDENMIQRVISQNPAAVVVMIGGSAIITENWREKAPAILMAWYPGMEGGHAIADILFGKVNPSGKLPCVFPKSEKHLPFFNKKATSIAYGLYHGYRLMEKNRHEPAFPFGFGLSYTTFVYDNIQLDKPVMGVFDSVRVLVDVTNTGNLTGEEIIQLYAGFVNPSVERPVKELKGFVKTELAPGERKRIEFIVTADQLAYYCEVRSQWVVEPGVYRMLLGPSSRMEDLLEAQLRITD
ncbi:MAG: glycosyl hydrolase [Desulfobacteraceae bacterium]|nr:MAG: glycosyl hydrolase [Desulfobacteraceae bacterium]